MARTYTPPPTVARFMRDDSRVRILMGPIGSGKSAGCVMELLRRAKMQAPGPDGIRRSRAAIVRNTRQQLVDTTLKTVLDWLPNGQAGTWKAQDMSYTIRLGDVETEWLFRPLDSPDDVQRLLSLELTFAWINECREIPEEIVTGVRSRLNRFPSSESGGISWTGLVCDTNYPDEDTFWHKVTELEIPEGWGIHKQPGAMEPLAENLEHLGQTPETLTWSVDKRREWGREQYYEPLLSGSSEDWIRVMVHAKYGRSLSGKPVYERSFVPEFHVAKEPLKPLRSAQVVVGMDFGRKPAAVFKQMDPRGRVLTLAQCHAENMGLERFLETMVRPVIAEKFPENRLLICGDPSGWDKGQLNEESVADIFRRAGFRAVPAPTNDPERRIAAVERWLNMQIDGQAMYLVCPTLTWLISGFKSGYRYRRKTNGSYDDKPDKESLHSHTHDANQYADLAIGGNIDGAYLVEPVRREVQQVSLAAWA
jgi:hypothetical protein